MKRMVSLVMVLLLVFSASSFASAKSSEEWKVKDQGNGAICLESMTTGEVIVEAFRFDDNGQTISVDLLEYARELNTMQSVQETYAESFEIPNAADPHIVPSLVYTSYSYEETSSARVIGGSVKVTADVVGPASITYGEAIAISDSYSVGITLNATIEKAIQTGASFSWQHSLSTTTNFSVTYNVPSGKTGYVKFTPYFNRTRGTLTKTRRRVDAILDQETYVAEAKCPIKLSNGFPDGTYAIVLK